MPRRRIVRRSSVAAGTALCAGFLSASLGAHAATSSSAWPQAGGDAAHSNRNNNETAITSGNVDQVHGQYSLGKLDTYGYCAAPYTPSAVASPSAVYYFDGRRIIASDLVTGQRLWRSEDLGGLDGTIISGLAVVGSRVILQEIGSCRSESDPGGVLLGYDVNTGSRVWRTNLADRDVSMVVSGNTVVSDSSGVYGAQIQAFNATTGAQLWRHNDCGSQDGGLFASEDNILTTCGAISFKKLGAANWTKPAGWKFLRADPSGTAGPNIYAVNPAGKLAALTSTGTVKWTSAIDSGPVLAAGPARLLVNCDGSSVCALNRTTGARLWKTALPAKPTAGVLAGDVAYLSPAATPLNATTGKPIPLPQLDGTDAFAYLQSGRVTVAGGHVIRDTARNVDVYGFDGL